MSETKTSRGTKLTSESGEYEEKKQVYRSKQATVEVTVKVKKRRHHDPEAKGLALPDKNFPKGSWGDLLSQNRVDDFKEAVKDVKDRILRKELTCVSEDGDNGENRKTLCHRIPISDDLYLETHTHVRSNRPSTSNSRNKDHMSEQVQERKRKQQRYEAENEFLRTQIENLRKEVEKVKLQNRKKKETYRSIKKSTAQPSLSLSSRIESRPSTYHSQSQKTPQSLKGSPSRFSASVNKESKHTSTTNIQPLVEKRSGNTQTDGKSPGRANLSASSGDKGGTGRKNDHLEMENQALRNEASLLLAEMQKAKKEQQESIMTIKELYQLAEILKRENQQLIGAQEQQQFIQEKLVQALTENQNLKGFLDTVMTKQQESTHVHDDQLAKIRNVIEEVKSTIAEEIQGITSQSQSSLYAQPEAIRAFDFNISEGGSALLNDTNASEIQRILGSMEGSRLNNYEEESSATAAMKAYLLTSPPAANIHRASTPVSNTSSHSRRSSIGSGKDRSYNKTRDESPSGSTKEEDHLDSLRQDISRSFKPIQMELNGSSSSEYRSTTSTPTNIVP